MERVVDGSKTTHPVREGGFTEEKNRFQALGATDQPWKDSGTGGKLSGRTTAQARKVRQQAEHKPGANAEPRRVLLASLHLSTAGRAGSGGAASRASPHQR